MSTTSTTRSAASTVMLDVAVLDSPVGPLVTQTQPPPAGNRNASRCGVAATLS